MTMNEVPAPAHDWIERLTPALRRFARALVVGRDRARRGDDLVQGALAVLARARGAAASDDITKADLYGRIVLAHRARPSGDATVSPPPRVPGIAHAIDRLPLDQREVLLLIVLEGLSYDEAAAILGIPRSSVLARLVRARGALSGTEKARGTPHLRVVK